MEEPSSFVQGMNVLGGEYDIARLGLPPNYPFSGDEPATSDAQTAFEAQYYHLVPRDATDATEIAEIEKFLSGLPSNIDVSPQFMNGQFMSWRFTIDFNNVLQVLATYEGPGVFRTVRGRSRCECDFFFRGYPELEHPLAEVRRTDPESGREYALYRVSTRDPANIIQTTESREFIDSIIVCKRDDIEEFTLRNPQHVVGWNYVALNDGGVRSLRDHPGIGNVLPIREVNRPESG